MFGRGSREVEESKMREEGELVRKSRLDPAKSGAGRLRGTVNKSYCGVLNCSNSTHLTPNLWFFRVPLHVSEPYRRQEWLKLIGRPEVQPFQRLLVCEKHFEDNAISGGPKSKKRLVKSHAVPTLLLPVNELGSPPRDKPKHVYQRTNISINKVYQKSDITPNNEKPSTINTQENIAPLSNDNQELQLLSLLCNRLANKSLDQLIKLYLKFKHNKESSNQVFSNEFKLKILHLYFGNPEAYKVLQSTLHLPPVSTLPRFIQSTEDGMNEALLTSLQAKITHMSVDQKYGVLCVNITRIRPFVHYQHTSDTILGIGTGVNFVGPVQYAIIVLVRGLTAKWHQILAVSLQATLTMFREFNTWIDNLILKLFEIGINIKAVVTGTDPFFINALALREIERLRPFFNVNYSKIYHVFDPLHTMLLLHNELKKNNIYYNKNTSARWAHISKFYKVDCKKKFRFIHGSIKIGPNSVEQIKLKSAAEILSLYTATGISTFVDLSILEKQAMRTADFIVNVNRIFTWLYPAAFIPEYIHLLTRGVKDFHTSNTEFLEKLNTHNHVIYGEDVKTKLKFIQCFILSIRSILHMQKESSPRIHESVLTVNLNLDPLVDIIDQINLKTEKYKYPTTTQLFEIIKEHYMHNTIENEKRNIDMDIFVENASEITRLHNCFTEPVEKTLIKRNFESYNEDYTQISYEDAMSIYYVSTYLLDKMYQRFKNSVSSRMKVMNSSMHYENRDPGFIGSIIVPDNDFLQFVYNMDAIFVNYCKKAMTSGKIFEELMKQMSEFIVTIPIDIGPLEYIIGLFVDLRIYHTIKFNNDVYEIDDNNAVFIVSRLSSPGLKQGRNKNNFMN